MRTLYDSTTAADIPADAAMVAGYVDGSYRWSDADWARFPNAVKVRIAVLATTNDGHVLDVEQGAATPDQAPAWVTMRRAAGADPTVYVNLGNVAAVIAACRAAAVALPRFWLAHYDNIAELPTGYVAKQYADEALTGYHYDASIVADVWPGVDNGGTDLARERYAREVEPFVKETIRLMIEQDAMTRDALTKAVGSKLAT